MIRALVWALLALPLLALEAPKLDKLPDWAVPVATASLAETPPAEAQAWVLLQKTEFAYTGGGEIRVHEFRLVRILGERGLGEAAFYLQGLTGRATRIKTLKGWNLRPDDELVKLDREQVVNWGVEDQGTAVGNRVNTKVRLERVMPGSFVAFESVKVINMPQGPATFASVLEEHPVRQWELRALTAQSGFKSLGDVTLRMETRNLEPWTRERVVTPDSLVLRGVAPRPEDERLVPSLENTEPLVYVAFLDPAYRRGPTMGSWDEYAAWVAKAYAPHFARVEPVPLAGLAPRAGLEALTRWMSRELSYQAVYMTAERGWIPETSTEVCRRRYGDCKDLASCMAGGAAALGLKSHPVLARINLGVIPADQPVSPQTFNHVILAVALERSLGLPAEVSTPEGRFLLVDATARLTPLGWLPSAHRGGRLLICTETRGLWVEVPAAAIEPESLEVRVRGAVSGEGTLTGALELKEEGDHVGLRGLALTAQPRVLRERVIALLGLGAEANLEVEQVSDPLDLAAPLALKARVVLVKGLKANFGEWSLRPVGLPPGPAAAVKSGRARHYPVAAETNYLWTCRFDLELPAGLVPRLREQHLDTPFREAHWKAVVAGGRFQGEFRVRERAAAYGFATRDQGVAEAKQDRSRFLNLRADAMTFLAP